MAKFRILHTRKTERPDIAEFDVEYIVSQLNAGDVFVTYDTHHPVRWTVLDIGNSSVVKARCDDAIGLGWDDQFAPAIVNTEARSRPEAFHYEAKAEK